MIANSHVASASGDDRPPAARSFQQLLALKKVWTGVSAETASLLNEAEDQILDDLFNKPSADVPDLLAKARAWGMVIENGGDEAHAWRDCWPMFVEDIQRLAGSAE